MTITEPRPIVVGVDGSRASSAADWSAADERGCVLVDVMDATTSEPLLCRAIELEVGRTWAA